MQSDSPRRAVEAAGRPLYPAVIPYSTACFVGAFLTDLAYWRTAEMQWANFSIWLLSAGLVMAGFAMLAILIDAIGHRRTEGRSLWFQALSLILVVALSIVNAFVHSRDAYTSVVPTGMTLSGVVVLILLVTGWIARVAVRHTAIGVVR